MQTGGWEDYISDVKTDFFMIMISSLQVDLIIDLSIIHNQCHHRFGHKFVFWNIKVAK